MLFIEKLIVIKVVVAINIIVFGWIKKQESIKIAFRLKAEIRRKFSEKNNFNNFSSNDDDDGNDGNIFCRYKYI